VFSLLLILAEINKMVLSLSARMFAGLVAIFYIGNVIFAFAALSTDVWHSETKLKCFDRLKCNDFFGTRAPALFDEFALL